MKVKDLTRPDRLIMDGLKTISDLSRNLYSEQKADAKARAELTFFGEKKMSKVESQLYEYDIDKFVRKKQVRDFSFLASSPTDKNYWLNFHGIHDVKLVQKVSRTAGLDRLSTRRILDTTQRPKMEEYDHYIFFSVKSISISKEQNIKVEQMTFVLGSNFVISFQEEMGDHFEPIRMKITDNVGYIRRRRPDYLLSQLLDAILDNYYETLEMLNAAISIIEKEVFDRPDKSTLIKLESHKQMALTIKKALTPMNEVLISILNSVSPLINESSQKYYRDIANLATAALEEADSILKTLEGLTNIYFASLSQKMNETMKVLTTVATMFIPLTFIVGVYGMNFEHMPELRHPYGYYITWGVMLIIGAGMFLYFRVKKWI